MKTQIVYVLIASEQTLFLEEMWASLYSLRRFQPTDCVVVLADAPTAERIKQRPALADMITELKVVPVPEEYNARLRSRYIKTSVRNLIDGDYLYIDTDTIICNSLDGIDNLEVKNLAMVPELHGSFKQHLWYDLTHRDVKRIFDIDVSDCPYWFNAGITFVKDNTFTREFFKRWNENWKHSAFVKGNTSDMRALLATDYSFGYKIECLPDVYNCQVAMSIQYFYDAKILHFWHMRTDFNSDLNYSPFCNKEIYETINKEGGVSEAIADKIINVKNSFRTPSMIVGETDVYILFSPFCSVLGRAYNESKSMHWLLDKLIKYTNLYYRAKRKLSNR